MRNPLFIHISDNTDQTALVVNFIYFKDDATGNSCYVWVKNLARLISAKQYPLNFQARLDVLREKAANVETHRAAFETLAGGKDGQCYARSLQAQVCQLEEELKKSYEEMESCLIRRVESH